MEPGPVPPPLGTHRPSPGPGSVSPPGGPGIPPARSAARGDTFAGRLRNRAPAPLVLLAWLVSLGVIAACWKGFSSPLVPINLATAATVLYFGWKASLAGPVWELLSLFQIFGSIGVGILGREFFSGLAGFTGIAGLLFGFYTGFFFTWLGTTLIMFYLKDPTHLPGTAARGIGFLMGAAEGMLLVGVVVASMALVPQLGIGQAGTDSLAAGLAEKALRPLIPDSASGTIEMVKLAGEMKNGFDPSQVDRAELQRELAPLLENPRLQELANDPELRALAEKRNFAGCLQHPKIRALLSDPELIQIGQKIDLHKVAATLRQGLVAPPK